MIKKLLSYDPCGRKSRLKTVAFLLRLSIYDIVMFGQDAVNINISSSYSSKYPLKYF